MNQRTSDLRVLSAGTIQTRHNGVISNIAGDHGEATPLTVRPCLWYRDAELDESGALTDLGRVIATHSELAWTGQNRGLGANGNTSANVLACLIAIWKGPSAAQDWKAVLQALAWPLAY